MQAKTVTLRDWQDALQVQDACNLSGVVHSWSRVMHRISDDSFNTPGLGTAWKNYHPINILYACKCADLSGQTVDGAMFGRAYDYACAVVEVGHPHGFAAPYPDALPEMDKPAPYTL